MEEKKIPLLLHCRLYHSPFRAIPRPLACYITTIWPHSLNKLIQRWLPWQRCDQSPSPLPIGWRRGGFECNWPPHLPVSWARAAPLTQFQQLRWEEACEGNMAVVAAAQPWFSQWSWLRFKKRVENTFLLAGKTFSKAKSNCPSEEFMSCAASGKAPKTSAQ